MRSLYEKLNRLDDSLVESKRVVKKKKLTESDSQLLTNKITIALIDISGSLIRRKQELKDRALKDGADRIIFFNEGVKEIIRQSVSIKPEINVVVYTNDDIIEDPVLAQSNFFKKHPNFKFINVSLNNSDEMLTESINRVKIEVKYETYGRYGDGGDIKTGRVSGSTEVNALMKMLDHVHMYTHSDYAEEFKEENGRYPTTEEVTDKLYEQNGDGCDLIYWIRNLTTGEMIFDGAVEESEPEEWDDDIDEILTEGVSKSSLIRWLKDHTEQDVPTEDFNTLVNNLWNVIEKENKERKYYKMGYKSIEEVDVPQLIDSSDNPVHDIGYRLLEWSDYDDDIDEMLTESTIKN